TSSATSPRRMRTRAFLGGHVTHMTCASAANAATIVQRLDSRRPELGYTAFSTRCAPFEMSTSARPTVASSRHAEPSPGGGVEFRKPRALNPAAANAAAATVQSTTLINDNPLVLACRRSPKPLASRLLRAGPRRLDGFRRLGRLGAPGHRTGHPGAFQLAEHFGDGRVGGNPIVRPAGTRPFHDQSGEILGLLLLLAGVTRASQYGAHQGRAEIGQ